MQIELDCPADGRMWRGLTWHVIGAVLLVSGLCASGTFTLIIWSLAAEPDSAFRPGAGAGPPADHNGAYATLLAAAITGSCWLGVFLLRRGRRGVLYLRHFGHTDGTAVLSGAARRIGARWRFITLDEGEIAAHGTSPLIRKGLATEKSARRWLTGIDQVLQSLAWARYIGPASLLAQFFLTVLAWNGEGWARPLAEVFLAIFAVYAAVLAMILLLGLAWLALLPPRLFLESAWEAAKKAEEGKRGTVRDETELWAQSERARQITKRVFAPRLAVISVEEVAWRRAVVTLAAGLRTALIDVSEPTENVLWEIGQLTRMPDIRCVFVGEYDRLVSFGRASRDSAACGEEPGRERRIAALLRALGERRVLAYETSAAGQRRFVRALRATLMSSEPAKPGEAADTAPAAPGGPGAGAPADGAESAVPVMPSKPIRVTHLEAFETITGLALRGGSPLRVLVIGSHAVYQTGALARLIADRGGGVGHLVGFEPKIETMTNAAAYTDDPRVRFCCGRAENIPFRDHSVDLIVAYMSFRLWAHRGEGLAECRRVLTGNGTLILADATARNVMVRVTAILLRKHRVINTPAEIEDMLGLSGFVLQEFKADVDRHHLTDIFVAVPATGRTEKRITGQEPARISPLDVLRTYLLGVCRELFRF